MRITRKTKTLPLIVILIQIRGVINSDIVFRRMNR